MSSRKGSHKEEGISIFPEKGFLILPANYIKPLKFLRVLLRFLGSIPRAF